MYWSKLFIPTLREAPAGIESAGLAGLVRAGYLRRLGGGAFAELFLARRATRRIDVLARYEMAALGAQEFRVRGDGALLKLGRELRSHKQLPQIWYQRALEACSFHATPEDLEKTFLNIEQAFRRVLDHCALSCTPAQTADGLKLMTLSESGDDAMVRAGDRVWDAASAPVAEPQPLADPPGEHAPEEFHTPGIKTIADLARFARLPETSLLKSLVMTADGKPVLALLRGDHQLSEPKLASVLDALELRPAEAGEIRRQFGADPGSLGPVGVRGVPIFCDLALRGRRNLIAGANRNDYHLRNVTPGHSFEAEFADLRQAGPQDSGFERATELAHLKKLSARQTKALDLNVSSAGAYRIALDRLLPLIAETRHDSDGLLLPPAIAPFALVITPVNMGDSVQASAAAQIYAEALKAGIDVLLDDRDERPGVKFKDADLIGVPCRITVGKKAADGIVEVVQRHPRQVSELNIAELGELFETLKR